MSQKAFAAHAFAAFALVLGAPVSAMAQPRLIAPPVSPADAAITIQAIGLPPNALATITVATRDSTGNRWQSRVTCKADEAGTVDLERCKPTASTHGQPDAANTYTDVDGMGLFWSMHQIDGTAFFFQFPSAPSAAYQIALATGGKTVQQIAIERQLIADGVARIELTKHPDGITGVAFEPRLVANQSEPANLPPKDEKYPAIILVGGSGGGHQQDYLAELLASHGYETLSLAFYNEPDLPDDLLNIPLETTEQAIAWLSKRPHVDATRIGIVGHSRGSEFALLSAANDPRIKAVVALAGSPVAWPGINSPDYAHDFAAWTYKNKPVAFLPSADYFGRAYRDHRPISTAFGQALDDTAAVHAAFIPIERINGPILFLGGDSDAIWPTQRFAKLGMSYLRAHRHSFADAMEIYPNAGHWFFEPYRPMEHEVDWPVADASGSTVIHFGGTIAGDAHAAPQAFSRMLGFLRGTLGKPSQ